MLEFKLITDNKIIIEKNLEYSLKDDVLRFKCEQNTFKIFIKDKLIIKMNKDTKISIDVLNKVIVIELFETESKFIEGLNIIEEKFDENSIYLKYEMLDEDKKVNEFIIKY